MKMNAATQEWSERYPGTNLGELRDLDPDLYAKVLAQMRDASAVGAEFDEDDEDEEKYTDEDVARFAAELAARMLAETEVTSSDV